MDKIYTFWENNSNLWFNASADDDKYITDTFINYINNDYINNDYINIINKTDWTSYCILFDQLLKHINRHLNIKNERNYEEPDNFLNNCYTNYNKFKDDLSDFEFMFQLMPIRHTHQLSHVKFVLNETWKRLELNKDNQFIRKFLIATYERYIKCTKETNLTPFINSDIVFIHDEILDKMTINSKDTEPYNLYNIMNDFISNNNLNNKEIKSEITVSLSGGVDSMVCSYLLKKIPNIKLSAVHIDYYNREECEKEEELLIWWCNTILDIPLYIRRIDEINRPKCMEYELRDLYESYTKDVRFNSYINLSQFIVLGHNKDDTIENILTNIVSQSHYENLLGMTPISNQSYKDKNICFLRPLINIPKAEIYQFAINNNIPFLQDSTPKWSQRGKIRDIVRPALTQWNPLIFDGLINLSNKMSEMTLLLDKIISPDINIKYNNIKDVPLDSIYWTTVLKKNNIYITQKTLINLINRIKHYQSFPNKLRDTQKIQLCKNTMLVLKENNKNLQINLIHLN
jgi:tRNA(Ile)-lysidine synthetase-like protein